MMKESFYEKKWEYKESVRMNNYGSYNQRMKSGNIQKQYATIFIIKFIDLQKKETIYNLREVTSYKEEISEYLRNLLVMKNDFEIFTHMDEIILVLNSERSEQQKEMIPILNELYKKFLYDENKAILIGIGNSYEKKDGLLQSYREASISMENNYFFRDYITFIWEIEGGDGGGENYPFEQEKKIIGAIEQGNLMSIESLISEYINALLEVNRSRSYVMNSVFELALSIYGNFINKDSAFEEVFKEHLSLRLVNTTNLDLLAVEEKLNMLARAIIGLKKKDSTQKNILDRAVFFIEKNYCNDITRETVAKEVFISPGYLSSLFKKEKGVGLVDYINLLRVKKACELLQNFPMKIYMIASEVGYENEKYFFKIFKKHMGMTPIQYRNQMKKR